MTNIDKIADRINWILRENNLSRKEKVALINMALIDMENDN